MEISEHIQKHKYRSGEYIFLEGDKDFHLYIVEKGRVEISTKNETGQKIHIVNIEEGESFGEFALLDRQPRSASAKTLTETVVLRVSAEGYESLIADLPVWASSMLRSFVQRLRMMTDRVRATPQFLEKTKA